MRITFCRGNRRPHPLVEALEGRELLAVAGSLDPSFGKGSGYATISTGLPVYSMSNASTFTQANYDAYAESAAVLPNGGVVMAGLLSYSTEIRGVSNESAAISVVELNANGSINTSFGTKGQVQLPIANPTDPAQQLRVAVTPTGQILVAYTFPDISPNPSGYNDYLVAELNANGSLDTNFGTGGVAEYPANTTIPAVDRLYVIVGVLPQSNGQIVLAGYSDGGFSAVRLNANGSLDTKYGTGGAATIPVLKDGSTSATAIGAAMQPDGQIVIVGTLSTYSQFLLVNSDIGVARLNADGSLDTTFGGSTAAGVVVIPSNLSSPSTQGFDTASVVAVNPSTGAIVIAAADSYTDLLAVPTNTLYRLNSGGTLDATFGTGGQVSPSLLGGSSQIIGSTGLTIQSNGDILLSNGVVYPSLSIYTGGADRLELTRLNPDGSTDTKFGGGPTPGVVATRLIANSTIAPVIDPTTGDILLAGVGTVPSLSGLTYGFTVASVLPSVSSGAAATPAPPTPPANFSGLGYSDAAVYQPTSVDVTNPGSGSFVSQSVLAPGIGGIEVAFGSGGVGGSIPAAADYLGVGFDQLAVYLPSIGVYAIQQTANSPGVAFQFGVAGAGQTIPVPADYYGTGQADIAIYIPSQGLFAIKNPTGKTAGFTLQFGIPGVGQSIPAPADYFDNGLDDMAVYLAQAGEFAILNTVTGKGVLVPYGKPGIGQSIPVPGDYDGSGYDELAVYIPSIGAYIYNANGGKQVVIPIGTANSGEIPVPGDYDGSGRTEAAIYDPAGGYIEYQPAKGGPELKITVGTAASNSLPVAAPAGALPGFGDYLSASGKVNAIRPEAAVPSSTSTAAPASVTVSSTKASAVPSGPTLASLRVARSLINQAEPDSSTDD